MAKDISKKVLSTATRLFKEKGIYQTGVDTLAKEAKVAKMSLYKYYPSKESLILAYLESETEEYFKHLDEVFSRDLHVIDKLKTLIGLEKENFVSSSNYTGCPFINASMEENDVSSKVHSLCLEAKEGLRLRIKTALEQSGYDNSLDLSHGVLLILNGLYVQAVMSNFQDCFSYAEQSCDILLR